MSRDGDCLIWGTSARIDDPNGSDGTRVGSRRAGGAYFISATAHGMISSRDDKFKSQLTSWLIVQRKLGIDCPEITSLIVKDVAQSAPLPVHDRADRFLACLASLSKRVGDEIQFKYIDQSNPATSLLLAWSESSHPNELLFLSNYLSSNGWLKNMVRVAGVTRDQVTVEGYGRLAALESVSTSSAQAFVAMWFDDTMNSAYEQGIHPAILETGFSPLRIDKKEHSNKIDDEIIAEIRRSQFLVVDFTHGEDGTRGGVYYEAGFAHGLNVPAIFTCKTEQISLVHFDTRQFNHIVWDSPKDLRQKLVVRIPAVIGWGPNKEESS
jgi:hypothetical protein